MSTPYEAATNQLQDLRHQLWVFNAVVMAVLLGWLVWGMTSALPFLHNWYDHMFIGSHVFLFLVPWSLAFISDAPRKQQRQWVHFIIVIVLGIWCVADLVVACLHFSNHNNPTADNVLNPANDARWCCIYSALAPVDCAPIVASPTCAVIPPVAALGVSQIFVANFIFLIAIIVLIIFDFIWIFWQFRPMVWNFEAALEQNTDPEAQLLKAPVSGAVYLQQHLKRQQELTAANATKKYVGRNNKR